MKILLILLCILEFLCAMPGFLVEAEPIGDSTLTPIRSRRKYGKPCNKLERCDKKAWLSCVDDICDCLQPEEMMYVPEKAACVSKSGERCKFQINEGGDDNPAIFEKTDCVENAECGSDGTCACLKNFYENFNGTCSPKSSYNESCSGDAYCQDDKFLSCIDGVCTCDSTRVLSNNGDGACRGRAGQPLGNTTSCIQGSSNSSEGICSCDEQLLQYAGPDGLCYTKKGYGSPCADHNQCNSAVTFLKCVDGFCGCDPNESLYTEFNGHHSVLDVERDHTSYYDNGKYVPRYTNRLVTRYKSIHHQCAGQAEKPCNKNGFCVVNSSCQYNTCRCTGDYVPTSIGACGIKFGGTCSKIMNCSDAFICTDGKCDCSQPNHQILKDNRCVTLTHGDCSADTDCIANAICTKTGKLPFTQCKCKDWFVENKEGHCDLAFGSKCSYNSVPCDSFAGLKCRNQICACPDSATHFDTKIRKCLGLVGSRCNLTNSGLLEGQMCVDGAKCMSPYECSTATCQCEDGWMVGNGRVCVRDTTTL